MPLFYDGLEDSTPWKLILDFDHGAGKFKLSVDGVDFLHLAYQAAADAEGPQFFHEDAQIFLNGKEIKMDQWSPVDFHLINNDIDVNRHNKTTQVSLEKITVSSAEVLNQLVYEIAETVEEDGLTELTLNTIGDVNGTI